jgi:signal transduction histidine kinase
MQPAAKPDNEPERLARLQSFGVLDTLPQKAFDDITTLASAICGTPIALISLVDSERQWFKSRIGLEATQTSREVAFCSHAILNPAEVMVVEDATLDLRFRDNPLVTEAPDIRFYAGAPIVTGDGMALGTVCVIDRSPRQFDASQRHALRSLASLVVTLLEHEKLAKAENERQNQEFARHTEYLTAFSGSGLDLMSFVDADYVYRYVNRTYLDYWNRKHEDIVGESVLNLMGESLFKSMLKPYLDQALSGEQVHYEACLEFPGKGPRHVEVTYLPAIDDDGVTIGVIVRAHDIHNLKTREHQLQETVAMLEHKTLEQERFIHILSHDLREPINTINNFASLLAEDESLELPVMARRNLNFVQAGGQRMGQLLDDLLSFVRLEQHAVDRKVVDLTSIVGQVREDLSAALNHVGGRIVLGHLPVYRGDASLLRIALQNLVSNGLKFSRKGVPPVVTVSAQLNERGLQLNVQDNGIGMPEVQLDKIFDMFKRLHSRKEYEGTGLGLSICRRIAELHGGSVTVTSDQGQGSCFTLTLPRQTSPSIERNGDEYL